MFQLRFRPCAAIALISLAGHAGQGLASTSPAQASSVAASETYIGLNDDLNLTEAQQAKLEDEAIKGSPKSARTLSTFHLIYRGDRERSLKWATIGAENGDSSCAFTLYILLNKSPDSNERQRDLFWLHKAADGGLGYAKDELKTRDACSKEPSSATCRAL
jgi:hypothetical protein